MITKFIGVKEWRQNMNKLWDEAKGKEITFVVLNHARPMFKVTPLYSDELNLEEWSKEDYHKAAENSFKFWQGDKDDNLFDTKGGK